MNLGALVAPAIGLAITGCAGTSDVSKANAHELVQAGARLVDVRTVDEYEDKHPPEAINIPLDELKKRFADIGPTSTSVVVYCHTGVRAAIATGWLRKAGYKVYNLGAMDRWYTETKGQPSKFD